MLPGALPLTGTGLSPAGSPQPDDGFSPAEPAGPPSSSRRTMSGSVTHPRFRRGNQTAAEASLALLDVEVDEVEPALVRNGGLSYKSRGDAPADKSERTRWRTCVAEVERLANAEQPGREYATNASFWDASNRLAVYLESVKMRPGRWHHAWESLTESIAELPSTLGAAGATATVLAKLAILVISANSMPSMGGESSVMPAARAARPKGRRGRTPNGNGHCRRLPRSAGR
jgi:hypothetical protein